MDYSSEFKPEIIAGIKEYMAKYHKPINLTTDPDAESRCLDEMGVDEDGTFEFLFDVAKCFGVDEYIDGVELDELSYIRELYEMFDDLPCDEFDIKLSENYVDGAK